jgi:hypothetical protein
VQIDPVKPTLKPPGTRRLKLKGDGLLSSFAFKFNLRRCAKYDAWGYVIKPHTGSVRNSHVGLGRAAQVAPIKTHVESAWN